MKDKMKRMEDEHEVAKGMVMKLTKELDHLTLMHSQILVENTKLINDKLRLEQELRKSESRYDLSVRTLQDKLNKEVSKLFNFIVFRRLSSDCRKKLLCIAQVKPRCLEICDFINFNS